MCPQKTVSLLCVDKMILTILLLAQHDSHKNVRNVIQYKQIKQYDADRIWQIFHVQHTCVPSGPITSSAPVVLYRKRIIFWKLSSPILQEPSTRKARSALAALQTGRESWRDRAREREEAGEKSLAKIRNSHYCVSAAVQQMSNDSKHFLSHWQDLHHS